MSISFIIKPFKSLTTQELYEVLQLRAEVFVVEQDCVYQDLDGKDYNGLHVLGVKNNSVIAYARIFDKGLYFDEPSIGRVVVAQTERKYGYGHDLMTASIDGIKTHYGVTKIKISAQSHLLNFYGKHGFEAIGTSYLEDGIPHIAMIRG